MKNNKILYLITIIMTLFSFNISANAAQELTCIYNYDWFYSVKSILIQKKDGTLHLYTHHNDASIDDYGWHLNGGGARPSYNPYYSTLPFNEIQNSKQGDYNLSFDPSSNLKNADGQLDNCPPHHVIDEQNKIIVFFDETNSTVYTNAADVGGNRINNEQKKIVIPDKITTNEFPNKMGLANSIDSKIYPNSCNYKKELDSGKIHYIQLYYGEEKMMISEYDPEKEWTRILYDPNNNSAVTVDTTNYSGRQYVRFYSVINNQQITIAQQAQVYSFNIDDEFTLQYLNEYYEGNCPPILAVERSVGYHFTDEISSIQTTIKTHGFLVETNIFVDKYFLNNDAPEFEVKFGKVNITSCEELFGEEISGYISLAWGLVKIAVPIILIIFGTIDFAQAIFSGKEDNMKKAQAKFIKRIAIAIVIFIIPLILGLLLETANGIWDNIGKDICGLIF